MSYNDFYKSKVMFKDYYKEFEYTNSYKDFLKKVHDIFNLSETIELKIFYVSENDDKILINNNDEYNKCKFNEDGYSIFEMEIKENKIENEIDDKENNINIKPNKTKIKYEGEENEFDYIEDFDNFIEECKFQFDISEISILNLYNTNKSKILVENKKIYDSLIPDKQGYLFFELQYIPNEEKLICISEKNDKFDESKINKKKTALNKSKKLFIDFNKQYNNNYLVKKIKDNLDYKFEELKNINDDYLNLKIIDLNKKINEKFKELNEIISKKGIIHRRAYSNNISKYKMKKENNFSIIKLLKNKIPYPKKKILVNNKSLKKCSCEFKESYYHYKFYNPPINDKKEIKIKNNGKKIWPKGCMISMSNKYNNQKINIYGITKREVNINEEITIQINFIINIEYNYSFKSSFKIYCNDYIFSYNNCEIKIDIITKDLHKIPRNNSKLLSEKIQFYNNKILKMNSKEVNFHININRSFTQLNKSTLYNLKSKKKKIIKENKSESNLKQY